MNVHEFFSAIGEYYAAGFFLGPNDSYLQRSANAFMYHFAKAPLLPYNGTKLYPVGGGSIYNPGNKQVYYFFYPHTHAVRHAAGKDAFQQLMDKAAEANIPCDGQLRQAVLNATVDNAFRVTFLRGWTHAVINYERILTEGLGAYERRIQENLSQDPDFFVSLLLVLYSIKEYIGRCEAMLRENNATKLANVFHKMASEPASDLYEAFVYYNFFWFIDDRDSGGRMDAILEKFPRNGLTDDDIVALFRETWISYNENGAWHATFSPHLPWLKPAMKAQVGLARPGSSVLIDDETPDDAWNVIFDSWLGGNTNPSLYFKPNYYKHLSTLWDVDEKDYDGLSFGGCTELMIMGKSNVGSTDGDLHALEILTTTPFCKGSFDDFYDVFIHNIRKKAEQVVQRCEVGHEMAGLYQPNLIRTLFMEDCIDNQREFNAGGARYNSGLIGVIGLTNTVNALVVIRRAYQGKAPFTKEQLAQALKDDFKGHDALLAQILAMPKFGNDNKEADSLAKQVIHEVADAVYSQSSHRRFYIPFINLFTTYAYKGSYVAASADGRHAGAPVGDSFGAVQGTDTCGPTALINSVTTPDQSEYLGTPVFNMRLNRDMIATPENRQRTKSLIMAYFHRGGLQIQVSVLDAETLRKAYEKPQDYPNVMVRIGGYSEYFNRLSKAVQLEVIKRTEHTLS
jgi:formate C-acetyltransferase